MQNQKITQDWNRSITTLPDAHLLQTHQWAQVKSQGGWHPKTQIWGDSAKPDAAALILTRTASLAGVGPKFRAMYIPKGPLLVDWGDSQLRRVVLDEITSMARQEGAIFLKIDPDIPVGTGIPGTPEAADDPIGAAVLKDLNDRGFHYSAEQIQFRNTVMIDLSGSEEELLGRMKQKTRYNIRLAARKGVTIRAGTRMDLEMLYQMYAETSLRDGFTIRAEDYYIDLWETFIDQETPTCQPLIAEVDGEPVAAVVIFSFASRAYYLHGMSSANHRNKMPNYLLQWAAIKYAKDVGCSIYDLWGAPEIFDEQDSMWGVFRFKRGLGGQVSRTIGAYDLPIRPYYYKLYTNVLPRVLERMRRKGNANIVNRLNDE